MRTVRCTCRVSTVSFRTQAQRSLEGVCFALRMWVIHKIRLHTHVGRLVVPVRPMAHHLGVGFVVKLDIEPFIVRSGATQVNSSQDKRGASGKPAAGVNNVKAEPVQCNRVVIEARNQPSTNLLAQDSLRTYRTLDFPTAVFTKLLIKFAKKLLVNKLITHMKLF